MKDRGDAEILFVIVFALGLIYAIWAGAQWVTQFQTCDTGAIMETSNPTKPYDCIATEK